MKNSLKINNNNSSSIKREHLQLKGKITRRKIPVNRLKISGLRGGRRNILVDTSIYAGPTFNNAPAPSTIPIPSISNKYYKDDLSEIQRDLRSLLKI
jgi:hypothetical protein